MQRNEAGQFKGTDPKIRFWTFVDKGNDNDCWLWTGNSVGRGRDARYGQFAITFNQPVYAHRYSYALLNGEIPTDHQIHHVCKNRLCVNPAHLELAHKYSHPDGAPVMRREMTHCKNGHEYTPENTYIRSDGNRRCRTCDNARYLAKVKPKREAAKAVADYCRCKG